MKDHLIFDTTDASTIIDSDSVGAFVRASDGTLITHHTLTANEHLDVYSATADGAGNPITSTGGALDVNIKSPITIDVDLNGIYNVTTNPLPDNVGIIGSSRAAPGLANQTLQFTGGGVNASAVSPTNIVAQDVNSFGMMWNGTTWDRITGAAATGQNVNITNTTLAVTQSTSPWVISGTVALSEDHNYGTVGANTLRTASQIGNATGAANFNYGAVGAQTLRVASQIGNATGAADFNSGTTTAQTLRVTLSTDTVVTTSDAALANTAAVSTSKTLAVAGTAQTVVTAPLAARKYLWIYNFANNKVYVGGATVTAANGFPISPGSYLELRAGVASPVNFVGDTGKTPEIRTLELS